MGVSQFGDIGRAAADMGGGVSRRAEELGETYTP